MPKVRVLHVLGSLNLGGAESRIMDLFRNIDRSKIMFDFAVHNDGNCYYCSEAKKLGASIFVLPKFKGINYFKYKKAWEIIFSSNIFNVIHGHMTTTSFVYLRLAKKFNIKKRIAHARSSNKDNFLKFLVSKLSRYFATELLAVSDYAAISEFGKKNLKNTQITYNSFEASNFFYDQNYRHLIREKLNIEDKFVIGHVGRFHKSKNHAFLVRVFKEIMKYNKNSVLILIGEGKLKSRILKLIKHYNLNGHVLIFDTYESPKIYSVFDCIIFPSKYEGFPGVVIEAQISKLNIAISDKISPNVIFSKYAKPFSLSNKPIQWAKFVTEKIDKSNRKNENIVIPNLLRIETAAEFYQELYLK